MLYSDFIRTRMNSLNVTAEATGYPCVLSKSKGKKLKDYKISGNTRQNGNPTPANPINPVFLGENTRNLFDEVYRNGYIGSGNTVQAFNQTVGFQYLAVIPCKPNTMYTVQKEYSTQRFSIGFADEYPYTGIVLTNVATNFTAKSLTGMSDSSSKYLVAFVYNVSIETLSLPNVWVTEGSSLTDYIPHNAFWVNSSNSDNMLTTLISLKGHDPLRRLGTIVDYIDYKNSRIVRQIGKLDLGSATWELSAGTYTTGYINIKTGGNQTLVCERYTQMPYASVQPTTPYAVANSPWARMAILVNDERYTNINDFKNSVNGLYLYYPLASNIYEPIDLPEIPTLNGTCTLTAQDDEISSSLIYAKYIK